MMGKRGLVDLSSWCPVMVERLFLAVPQGCLLFVIVVFPDHTHLLFLKVLKVPLGGLLLGNSISTHLLKLPFISYETVSVLQLCLVYNI